MRAAPFFQLSTLNFQHSTLNFPLTPCRVVRTYTPSLFSPNLLPNMGKQYNKTEKKRRRLNYLARRKAKVAAAGKAGVKKSVKRPVKKKAAVAAAA